MTSDSTKTYSWDARNHLASIGGGVTASFQYDPFGRRVTKSVAGSARRGPRFWGKQFGHSKALRSSTASEAISRHVENKVLHAPLHQKHRFPFRLMHPTYVISNSRNMN